MHLLLAVLPFVVAPSHAAPSSPLREVSQALRERSGLELPSGSSAPAAAAAPLTAQDAARLALTRNALFRARLEELGVAEADLREAGLLANPRVHGAMRYVGTDNGARGHELGVKFDLLSLLQLPLKRRVASGRMEQARFRLGQDALAVAAEAKAAFYAYSAAAERLRLRRESVEVLDAAAELAARLREAGNISRLEHAAHRAAASQARVELGEEEARAAAARERLALAIGWQEPGAWTAEPGLPEPPESDPEPAAVEAAALAQRWDLQAAREDPELLRSALRAERLGLFSPLEVGVDTEREYGGATGYGPEFEVGVPLFDRRQAAAARLRARRRQSLASADALEASIRLEVREASAELAAARKAAALYREELLPARRELLGETLKNYNYMLKGVFELLEAKREELAAAEGRVEALRRYWTRRAELERAAGGRLPAPGEK